MHLGGTLTTRLSEAAAPTNPQRSPAATDRCAGSLWGAWARITTGRVARHLGWVPTVTVLVESTEAEIILLF